MNARHDNAILDLDFAAFISDSWGDFVIFYTVTNGNQDRTELVDDQVVHGLGRIIARVGEATIEMISY